MLLLSVLGATATVVFGCTSQASPSASVDLPTGSASNADQDESASGPADLRVHLEAIVLGGVSATPPTSAAHNEHSQAALQSAIEEHRAELVVCTDKSGGASGEFSLFLELDADGYVLGGSSNPPAGQEGLSAVAGCTQELARSWLFPSRKRRGRTILIVPFIIAGM